MGNHSKGMLAEEAQKNDYQTWWRWTTAVLKSSFPHSIPAENYFGSKKIDFCPPGAMEHEGTGLAGGTPKL